MYVFDYKHAYGFERNRNFNGLLTSGESDMLTRDIARLIKKQSGGDSPPAIRSLGRGLSLKVTNTGNATYLYRFQLDGKPAAMKIGDYPALSPDDAAQLAEQCRTWLKSGADPRVMFRFERPAVTAGDQLTVRGMVELWLERSTRKTKAETLAAMELHIFPRLGDMPADQLQTRHWIDTFDGIARGKHTGRPAPSVARRLLADLKAAQSTARLMQRCEGRALDDIPAGFVAPRGEAGTRTLTRAELGDVLRWTTNTKAPAYYRNIARLLVALGARTVELRLSELPEWDLDAMIWTVPPEHSKTGEEIARPIPAALLPMIKRLIEQAKRAGSALLLREERRQDTVAKYLGNVWKKLGHDSAWSAHDLRRTFRTELGELGIAPWVGELLLGHAVQGVAGVYNRAKMMTEKRQALETWYNELNRLERAGVLSLASGGMK